MEKYGKLDKNGNMLLSSKQLEGYKPVVYAEIPKDFDQTIHYIVQTAPVDNGDHIFVGVEMYDLPKETNEDEGFDEGHVF